MERCEHCDQLSTRSRIAECLSMYCHYLDGGDFDLLRELFTHDASIELGQSYSGDLDRFISWAEEQRRSGKKYSHHVTNFVLKAQDDADVVLTISAVAALVISGESGAPARLVHGIYNDNWVRSSDVWRLAKRRFEPRITVIIPG